MTAFIILEVVFTLILGFALSGLLVGSKLQIKNKIAKGAAFFVLGNVFSVGVMALTVFILWPTKF